MRLQETAETSPTYPGIARVDLTTASHLLDPERTFQVANALNKGKDRAYWVGIELYPTLPARPLALLQALFKRAGLSPVTPPRMTPETAQRLLEKYSHTKATRVHLEFNYNLPEAIHQILVGERANGINYQIYKAVWLLFFHRAQALNGIKLAKSLGVGVNAHANILEGLKDDGKLQPLWQTYPVLVENDRKQGTILFKDHPELMYDPIAIAEKFVQREKLADGLLLEIDHLNEDGRRTIEILQHPLIRKYTKALHWASANHGAVSEEDPKMAQLLSQIWQTPFAHPVRAALDYRTQVLRPAPLLEEVRVTQRMANLLLTPQG